MVNSLSAKGVFPIKKIRPPKVLDYVLLLVLAAMFSSSFVLMKISVQTVPTLVTVWMRLIVAFLVLISFMIFRGITFPNTEKIFFWKYCVLLGITANIIPFSLITWAEKTIDSNLASLYMATIPIFSIVLAHLFSNDEKMTKHGILGMLVSICGTAYLLEPSLKEVTKGSIAQFACLSAAFFYAFSRIQTKKINHIDPVATSTGVLAAAIITMFPFIFLGENINEISPSSESLISIILLGVFPTAIAYVILYSLIANVGAVFMTSVNYLVPCFGIIWGSIVLSEEPSTRLLFSLVIIFFGLWIGKGKFAFKISKE